MPKIDDLPNPLDDDEDEFPDGMTSRLTGTKRPLTLAAFALRAAADPVLRRHVLDMTTAAVVIEVPAPEWVNPIAAAVPLALGEWAVVITASKTRKPSSFGFGEEEAQVAKALAQGGRVIGISHAPDTLLPPALLGAADIRIRMSTFPSNEVLARVIRVATGETPKAMAPGLSAGLGYFDILAAVRAGSSAQECVARLAAAAAKRLATDPTVAAAPPLSELHGYGEAMEWAQSLVDGLEDWRAGRVQFSDLDRAVVLASEPGMGKTTFARSVAKAAGIPLVTTSVAAWFTGSGYLDGLIKAVDAVAAQARASEPVLIFLDEMDALPDRRTLSDRGRDWWTPLVTHCLMVIEGLLGPTSRVCVMGATNHANRIDPALIRPGRLNRVITIKAPDAPALAGIMRQHLGTDLADVDLRPLARVGVGATGAQAVGWIRAARAEARAADRPLDASDLLMQIAPPDDRSPATVRRVAIHEAGHALVSHVLGATVETVSIIEHGLEGGRTSARTADHGGIYCLEAIEAQIMCGLAGMAAESILTGEASTGSGGAAESDLAEATRLVASLHGSWGLKQSLTFLGEPDDLTKSLTFDAEFRKRVEADLRRLFAQTCAVVREHRHTVEAVALALTAVRHLGGAEFLRVVEASRRARAGQPNEGGPHA